MQSAHLLHVGTGGTIDSSWDAALDTALPNKETFIPTYFKHAYRKSAVRSTTLFMKDSREITLQDQDLVTDVVTEVHQKRIILTSGTYLMADLARVVAAHPIARSFSTIDKRVILTGSLVPIKGYLNSDGGFNLGMTMALLDEPIIERVSIVINGKCFRGKDARKDLSSATFKEVEENDQMPFDYFQLIATGGTMDSEMNSIDEVVVGNTSKVPAFLRQQVRIQIPFDAVAPFLKDSRDISAEDTNTLVKLVRDSSAKHILITAGIYKIKEIQQALLHQLGTNTDKRVIITGSRNPLGISDLSDAPFALGFAYGRLGFVPQGVHAILNSKVLQPNDDILEMYTQEERHALWFQDEWRRMKYQMGESLVNHPPREERTRD